MNLSLLRSVRFNIFLFCLLAAFSALGTFLPQIPETPEKVEAFLRAHTFWGPVFSSLGLFELYYSFWFTGLLGLMAFNIIVCKLYSAPPDPGLAHLPPEMHPEDAEKKEQAATLQPYHSSFHSGLAAASALERIQEYFKSRRYFSRTHASGSKVLTIHSRHRIQGWGSYISHVSLVVVLAGALIKGLFGFEEMLPILEGRSQWMKNRPWEVFVDKFEMAFYKDGETPRLFASEVRVLEKDGLLAQKRIVVNDPLALPATLGKVKIYQASWGATGMFKSATLKVAGKEVVVPMKKKVPVPGAKGIEVTADVLMPNFTVGPGNRAEAASLDFRNPAVRFRFFTLGRETAPLWLFQKFPELCFTESEEGVLSHAPPPPFSLASIDPVLFSGLQVAYDPGFPVVVLGSIGLLSGLSALFYLHRRVVWVWASSDGATCRITIGAWSSRGEREFDREFYQMTADLKKLLKESEEQSYGSSPV